MSTTIEHDESHTELPANPAVVGDGAPAQLATPTDTVAVTPPSHPVPGSRAQPFSPGPHRQSDAPWIAVALVALAAVVIGSLVWLSGQSAERPSTGTAVPDAVVDTPIDPTEALGRLAERGYIPHQASDRDQAITSELVGRALVPSGRFDDPAMHDLQTRGLVPMGTTLDEDGALRELQSRGLVPSGRFDDPALRELQSRGHLPTARGGG